MTGYDAGKAFNGNVVLDGIDLRIDRGEAVVVAGPSGSGKSTMLRRINGLERIDAGSISFDGQRVDTAGRGISRLRAEIGMVFQQFNLFPHMTVERNIALAPVQVRGVAPEQAGKRARELLERVGIPEKASASRWWQWCCGCPVGSRSVRGGAPQPVPCASRASRRPPRSAADDLRVRACERPR